MILIVSLFEPTAMANNRVFQTLRTLPGHPFRTDVGPVCSSIPILG
ncbi:MAG: hypothetical protein L0387_14605 [Acidobacteria bacterium]|nr:hypothetical protein [Acidobacteriota bacterium]MCI0622862.1 hypothetical protein [Acidobacteriota bacterium]MCI0722887.1 hypothetical protein [Acidobacteriota bacterium]